MEVGPGQNWGCSLGSHAGYKGDGQFFNNSVSILCVHEEFYFPVQRSYWCISETFTTQNTTMLIKAVETSKC
jgi:hypothetical protein